MRRQDALPFEAALQAFPPTAPFLGRVTPLRVAALASLTLVLAYVASPYVVLYRLAVAVGAGNSAPLVTAIDWPKMRDALRQDVENGIAGETVTKPNDDDLPAFGSGFLTNMAAQFVEREVTPNRLGQAIAGMQGGHGKSLDAHVTEARFVGLTRFMVAFRTGRETRADPPVRLYLDFSRFRWRVTGADVPQCLLATVETRAS